MSDLTMGILFYNGLMFVCGITIKAATRHEREFDLGFRIIYLFMPTFFVGYYISDFLLKDWTEK